MVLNWPLPFWATVRTFRPLSHSASGGGSLIVGADCNAGAFVVALSNWTRGLSPPRGWGRFVVGGPGLNRGVFGGGFANRAGVFAPAPIDFDGPGSRARTNFGNLSVLVRDADDVLLREQPATDQDEQYNRRG